MERGRRGRPLRFWKAWLRSPRQFSENTNAGEWVARVDRHTSDGAEHVRSPTVISRCAGCRRASTPTVSGTTRWAMCYAGYAALAASTANQGVRHERSCATVFESPRSAGWLVGRCMARSNADLSPWTVLQIPAASEQTVRANRRDRPRPWNPVRRISRAVPTRAGVGHRPFR
jgi:hypothetical protein